MEKISYVGLESVDASKMASEMEHVDLKQNVLATFIKALSIDQGERRNAEDKIKILETTESKPGLLIKGFLQFFYFIC